MMQDFLKEHIRGRLAQDFKKVRTHADLLAFEKVYGDYLPPGFLEAVWEKMSKKVKRVKRSAAQKTSDAKKKAARKKAVTKKAAASKKAKAKVKKTRARKGLPLH